MIEKKYLFNNKDEDDYVTVCIQKPAGLGLSFLYEGLFSVLDPEIETKDVFIVGHQINPECLCELTLDVEDIDFSEFED
jgi:hypothetical protein